MPGFELCECEAVLQLTGHLDEKMPRSAPGDGEVCACLPCSRERTLPNSALLNTLSATASGCFFNGDDMLSTLR